MTGVELQRLLQGIHGLRIAAVVQQVNGAAIGFHSPWRGVCTPRRGSIMSAPAPAMARLRHHVQIGRQAEGAWEAPQPSTSVLATRLMRFKDKRRPFATQPMSMRVGRWRRERHDQPPQPAPRQRVSIPARARWHAKAMPAAIEASMPPETRPNGSHSCSVSCQTPARSGRIVAQAPTPAHSPGVFEPHRRGASAAGLHQTLMRQRVELRRGTPPLALQKPAARTFRKHGGHASPLLTCGASDSV